jgi:hypothetical protein
MEMPATATRVPANTAEPVNQRIRHLTEASIAHYAVHPEQINQRLEQLDREWDTERTLEANAASLAFAGTALGALSSRWWLLLPATVTAFLFQHAVQGWCPPLPVLRRLGVRTAQEIEAERYALKALRGDFKNIPSGERGTAPVLEAVAHLGNRRKENQYASVSGRNG